MGSTKYECGNTDTAQCDYVAADGTSPTVTAIAINTDKDALTVTGTTFDTAATSIDCTMLGVTGTGVASDATSVVCTFTTGVPITDTAVSPSIVFKTSTDGTENTAITGGITITNAAGTSVGETGLSCSFAGGCLYTITGTGLTSSLQGDDANTVTVCEQECVLDTTTSTISAAKCTLPALMTTYSAATFNMADSANISPAVWAGTGTAAELLKLSDGDFTDDFTSSTTPCYVSVSATTGYVYQL